MKKYAGNEAQYLKFLLSCLDAKCPCGGNFNDWHSHASDCVTCGGDKEYRWKGDEETPSQRNSKIRHSIKGKMSPVCTLVEMTNSPKKDEPMYKEIIEDCASTSKVLMPEILSLLDEIE